MPCCRSIDDLPFNCKAAFLIAPMATMKAQSCALSLIMPLPKSMSPSTQAVSSFFSFSLAFGPNSGPVSICALKIKLLKQSRNRRNRVDALFSYKLQLPANPVLLEAREHGFTQDALLRVRAKRVPSWRKKSTRLLLPASMMSTKCR